MIMHRTLLNTCAVALVFGATFIAGVTAVADQVIPDDLIVQGSTCIGLDCVNNEAFGFDTLILKENNLRIFFNDTSVSAGFPANKWRITVNDSVSGGSSFFALDDVTGNRTGVFRVQAGAPSASLHIASSGNVGIGTTVPVLDLSLFSGDTPAIRLEQSGSQGFTGQTWDVAGNEANFFVRDVTGGSRLPLRIRPGAPTSSLDIAASGNVGIGTASPSARLNIQSTSAFNSNTNVAAKISDAATPAKSVHLGYDATIDAGYIQAIQEGGAFKNLNLNPTSGNVGIGTTTPAARLHTVGTVRLAGVTGCGSGIQSNASGDLSCLVSSRQFKNIVGDLPSNVALANVMALRPQTGSYKDTPDVPEHWLIAEDVAAVDQALAGLHEGKPYVVKTQNVVADLVAVVQQQQRRIDELERLLSKK